VVNSKPPRLALTKICHWSPSYIETTTIPIPEASQSDVNPRSNSISKTQKRLLDPKKLKSKFDAWPNNLLNRWTKIMEELDPLITKITNLTNLLNVTKMKSSISSKYLFNEEQEESKSRFINSLNNVLFYNENSEPYI
jgi:hypothetical protein